MNAIAYSIFGANEKHDQCLDFRSYLRGLHLNIRVAELLYPGWRVCVMTDEPTAYNSPYGKYLTQLGTDQKIDLYIGTQQPLCLAMLSRLLPIYINNQQRECNYERVICRDTDSLLSYRERQAVAYWERGTKTAHAITDSISHTIDLMGGMIGFVCGAFRDRVGPRSWEEFLGMATGCGIDYHRKGADQDFLNRYILPRVHDSITEHYILGHPQSFRGDCFNYIQDIDVGPEWLRETNGYAFHIGAAGFQVDAVVKMLLEHGKDNAYWAALEKQYKETFYWQL